jgi:NADH-quinone oxidoreductase subunit M
LLSLAIWLPILGGLAVLATGSDRNAGAGALLALAVALAGFLVTIAAVHRLRRRRPVPCSSSSCAVDPALQHQLLHLGVDGISMLFILLNSFITIWWCWPAGR